MLLKPLPFPHSARWSGSPPTTRPPASATSAFAARAGRLRTARRRVRGDRRHLADHREPDRDRSTRAGRSPARQPQLLRFARAHAGAWPHVHGGDKVPGIATVAVISDGLWRRGFGSNPGSSAASCASTRTSTKCRRDAAGLPRIPAPPWKRTSRCGRPRAGRRRHFRRPGYSARFMASAIGRVSGACRPMLARRPRGAARQSLGQRAPGPLTRPGWAGRRACGRSPRISSPGSGPRLVLLMAGIVCVMLIAISNISNLLLVRAVEREREVAIQRALGASRSRYRQPAGRCRPGAGWRGRGYPGQPLGRGPARSRLVPRRLARVRSRMSTCGSSCSRWLTAVVAGSLVGVAPAMQSARADVERSRKTSGQHPARRPRARPATADRHPGRSSVFLLMAAALLVRSLWNVQTITPACSRSSSRARVAAPAERSAAGPYLDRRQARRAHPRRP